MTLTLTQYRARTLDLLDDPTQTRYTTAQIDAALRAALIDYATFRPILRTYQVDTTGDKVITLPADFTARIITRVQTNPANPNAALDLLFVARLDDEQWTVEIIDAIYPPGQVLTITYTAPHTIDGLDSAVVTTIDDDNLLTLGAAAYAAQTRAVSRAETINMQPQVQKQLLDLANTLRTQYLTRLPQIRGISAESFQADF